MLWSDGARPWQRPRENGNEGNLQCLFQLLYPQWNQNMVNTVLLPSRIIFPLRHSTFSPSPSPLPNSILLPPPSPHYHSSSERKMTGFPNNESIFFSLSRITLSPVADIFVVWARCSEDGKIRGFILEKVCCYCTSCKYGCENTHSTLTHTHILTGYERSLCS